jgi:ATP-dependent Clp protease ATP-binding subunit ClpC
VFERFTDRARRVVVLAQEEARLLSHNYIGSEHLLLGLIQEGDGVAAKTLESLDVSLSHVRAVVEDIVGRGQAPSAGHIPFTPRAKKILELSLKEALQLSHNYIGTEHILLGLIREGEGVGAQVLTHLGANLDRVRERVVELLGGSAAWAESRPAEGPVPGFPRCLTCSGDLTALGRHKVVGLPSTQGDDIRSFLVVFCGRCGEIQAVVPEPPEGVAGSQ